MVFEKISKVFFGFFSQGHPYGNNQKTPGKTRQAACRWPLTARMVQPVEAACRRPLVTLSRIKPCGFAAPAALARRLKAVYNPGCHGYRKMSRSTCKAKIGDELNSRSKYRPTQAAINTDELRRLRSRYKTTVKTNLESQLTRKMDRTSTYTSTL